MRTTQPPDEKRVGLSNNEDQMNCKYIFPGAETFMSVMLKHRYVQNRLGFNSTATIMHFRREQRELP